MSVVFKPWQLLLVTLAGWVNENQQRVIEFQNAQIEVLLNRLGKKRLLLSDDERRRLAVKGKLLGRKALQQMSLDQEWAGHLLPAVRAGAGHAPGSLRGLHDESRRWPHLRRH